MKMRTAMAAMAVLATCAAVPVRAAEDGPAQAASGTVQEMGYGKIALAEQGGLTRTFLEGRRDTTYDPVNWRPEKGDQLEITFVQREQKLVAKRVHLTKIGPNNVDPADLASPLAITITEVGKSGVIGTMAGKEQRVRFATGRKTEYAPVGWKPQVGEKAVVTFHSQPNNLTFNVTLAVDKIERQ